MWVAKPQAIAYKACRQVVNLSYDAMIANLRLMNFRCFDAMSVDFPASGAVIVGANAQGKTSILEAVCVLVRLHSPRSLRMGKMIQIDSPGFGIAGECWQSDRQVRFSARQGVEMKVDDEVVGKQGDYLAGGGLVVWMGNDDLDLVRGSGRVRRRYLDFLGCQLDPVYRDHFNRYQRVLKARNLLLKDRVLREPEIAAYTDLLIRHGSFLTKARRELVGLLLPEVVHSQLEVSGNDERVGLEYVAGAGDDMVKSLEMTHERERRLGQTVAGPHRDEVRLTVNGMAAADFASEGQQRTLALSLKLAQGALLEKQAGRMPVYLLDDIFGELDADRRNALMQALPDGAQKLITTTNIDWMQDELDVIEVSSLK
ncbi:DNA replication/repair protein RecF [Oceaniferula marina]|nr:DNA replication and repair protein RecF [Oceaniferula marina]